MSEAKIRNLKRLRAIQLSRPFKRLFLAEPKMVEAEPEGVEISAERLFFGENSLLKDDAQMVLSDLRDFCFARTSTFSNDALAMARREGRREVWLRLIGFLNLDEKQVQTMMEVDDGY
jgi:hypothetical protein